jgi:hypothetical protein
LKFKFILFDLGHGADVTPFRPVRVTDESCDTGSQIAARALMIGPPSRRSYG